MSETAAITLPTAEGVRAAARRLAGEAVLTPLVENLFLNERAGGRIFLKAETFQHTGSFKFRGAYNRLSQLSPAERKCGVLAWSSGNHAQGVALAARMLGMRAVIVMPADAPAIKRDNVIALGAEIVRYDRYTEDREALGRALAEKDGLILTPSFDHIDIIEGQGTAALEAAEQARRAGADLDAFIVCCGGGGLTAGCATILAEVSPGTEVMIAEPEGYDEARGSLSEGKRLTADVTRPTICDAIATPSLGEITFEVMRRHVRRGFALTEQEVAEAVEFAFRVLKLAVEPGGAVALAAVLSGKFDAKGKNVGLTLSGGNVDPNLFSQLLERGARRH